MVYMTPEFESAVFKLDTAIRNGDLPPCCVYVHGKGKPTVNQYMKSGAVKSYTLIGGEWCERRELDG